jgi:hypothetical protein
MEKDLSDKEVAIVALGASFSDYVLSRINSTEYAEVWGINSIGAVFHVDRTFMMDPASRFLDDVKAGTQTGIAKKFLLETPNKGPIYSCCLDDRVPEIVEYPLEDSFRRSGQSLCRVLVSHSFIPRHKGRNSPCIGLIRYKRPRK